MLIHIQSVQRRELGKPSLKGYEEDNKTVYAIENLFFQNTDTPAMYPSTAENEITGYQTTR
jgi:hypothetical protein